MPKSERFSSDQCKGRDSLTYNPPSDFHRSSKTGSTKASKGFTMGIGTRSDESRLFKENPGPG